jgi:hypothetical protein
MKPLIIQFSGGKTSGFMSKFLQEYFPDREKHYLFENTGKEDERTLEFVNECDRRWNLNVVWLEAVVHFDERKSTTYKVVTFETASRNGEPYEAVIQKYGIPNIAFPHCTRELKKNVSGSYISSLGLEDYEIAIGIRADEAHRINRKVAKEEKLIYPLTDIIQVDKRFIDTWWDKQDFNLNLPHYLGNCDLCFKKSLNKLITIVREEPGRLRWWHEMERKYKSAGAGSGDRTFYRGHRSAKDIDALATASPTFFNNPEFEVETDCFCKST